MRKRKNTFLSLASIAVGLLALFLITGNLGKDTKKVAAADDGKWVTQVGAGLVAPACGSSSASAPTCNGSTPQVTLSWTVDPSSACQHWITANGAGNVFAKVSVNGSQIGAPSIGTGSLLVSEAAGGSYDYSIDCYLNSAPTTLDNLGSGTFVLNGNCGSAAQPNSCGINTVYTVTQPGVGIVSSAYMDTLNRPWVKEQSYYLGTITDHYGWTQATAIQYPAYYSPFVQGTTFAPGASSAATSTLTGDTWYINFHAINSTQWTCTVASVPPTITGVTINSPAVTANGTSQYTITETATDATGGSAISTEQVLISDSTWSTMHGYFAWNAVPFWSGTTKTQTPTLPVACTGTDGGYGAIYKDAPDTYGAKYLNLVSCDTSVSGNTRTVTYVVSFDPLFTTPTTGNVLWGYTFNTTTGLSDGWKPFDTFDLSSNNLSAPTGSLDGADCSLIQGWAADKDTPSASIQVKLYKDGAVGTGTLLGSYDTTVYRADVNAYLSGAGVWNTTVTGSHGYAIPTPSSFGDNAPNHKVYAYGVDSGSGALTLLPGSPWAMPTCNGINAPPQGLIESATCSTISGYAFDSDSPATSISVDLYKDGVAGGTTMLGRYSTSVFRSDVNASYGLTGNHGFSISVPNLGSGSHTIWVYGIDSTGGTNAPLAGSGSPQTTLSCTYVLPTATLTATPSTIDSGQSSNLTWSSTNATSCTAAGGFSTGDATSNAVGVSTGSLSVTSNYQITCTGAGGTSLPATATVTVLQPNITITAIPDRVKSGDSTTVSWNASNVDSCVITRNGAQWQSLTAAADRTINGAAPSVITSQTTFLMTCNNNSANAVVSATQVVNLLTNFTEF